MADTEPRTQSDHILHLLPGIATASAALALDALPAPVLAALRAIREVRNVHIGHLSWRNRKILAAAEALHAAYISIEAQIGAVSEDAEDVRE